MERMKLIFLDVDGVLNYSGCKARSATGCLGIDDEKVKLLRQIIDQTGAICYFNIHVENRLVPL